MTHFIHGAVESKWHNPFNIKDYGLTKSIEHYEEYNRQTPILMQAIPELAGLNLGCWCIKGVCQGEILIKLFKELSTNEDKELLDATEHYENHQDSINRLKMGSANEDRELLDAVEHYENHQDSIKRLKIGSANEDMELLDAVVHYENHQDSIMRLEMGSARDVSIEAVSDFLIDETNLCK